MVDEPLSGQYEQLDLFGITRGTQDMKDAHAWRQANFAVYCAMKKRAMAQAANGQRVAIDELFNWARYSLPNVIEDPSTFKMNNNLRAPLARLMIEDWPPLADYMETREARCDFAMMAQGRL